MTELNLLLLVIFLFPDWFLKNNLKITLQYNNYNERTYMPCPLHLSQIKFANFFILSLEGGICDWKTFYFIFIFFFSIWLNTDIYLSHMANVNTKGNQKTTMSWCNNKQNDIEMYHNNTIDDILTDDKQHSQQQKFFYRRDIMI